MMAPDGRCKTFDAAADGFVRAEGCGMIVLKRLSDAIAQNDHILAVIRGSAVNQDGASSGLTVPNGPAQEAVLREALRAARVAPADVGYVEAHGTGTTLGDPIELEALDAVLSEGRPADRTLTVGSIKTNVGHLEAASGIAGLIKVVLSLQHERIPRHLHFKTLNPHITLRKLDVVVPQQSTPWPSGQGPRIAGVSSFGFSGTNAHVVIEEAPAGTRPGASAERPLHVLTISARSESALAEQAGRWAQRLETRSSDPVADVAYTANAGRTHFAHRAAIVAKSTDNAREQLMAIAKGETPPDTVRAHVTKAEAPKIAFLFTGQGSQYIGMGRQLYDTQPTFRAAIDRCEGLLRDQLERPLLSVLYPESGQTSPLDDTAFTQPSLFALEFALAELWRSWGVEPAFVMGHSVGEFAAACVAGAFSLEDAVKLIASRGRLMQKLPRGGAMAAVLAGEVQVKAALAPHGAALSIAAINGPSSVVISGEERALLAVLDVLSKQGISSQRLTVSHAFHSALMEPMLDEFEQVARQARPATPRIRIVSNVTGRLAAADEFAQPSYWRKHARQAVRFFDGIQTLYNLGVRDFLEIGPSPTLIGMARQFTDADGTLWLASLRRGRTDWQEVLSSVSALYARGVDIDWRRFDGDYSRRRLQMPTYPFERQRYWIDKPESAAQVSESSSAAASTSADVVHPLLGRRIPSALKDILYESRLSAESIPFVAWYFLRQASWSSLAPRLPMRSAIRLPRSKTSCSRTRSFFPRAVS
jgi:acyl transferase domain-containing protein